MNKLVLWRMLLSEAAKSERGAGFAEYAVLLVVIAIPLAAVVGLFAGDLTAAFNDVMDALPGGGAGG